MSRADWLHERALETLVQTTSPPPESAAAAFYRPEAIGDRYAVLRRLLAGLLGEQRDLTAEEWTEVALVAGRNGYPSLLWAAFSAGALAPGEVTKVVADAWSLSEFPLLLLTRGQWRALFDAAGFTVDGVVAERPTAPVRVWRGARPGLERRWSWTTDRDRAEWFADRFAARSGGGGQVWTTLAPPDALLAMIGESHRDEAEVVVDTRGLRLTLAAVAS